MPALEKDGSGEINKKRTEINLQMREERRRIKKCWREIHAGKIE